jgi:hypothetical protein
MYVLHQHAFTPQYHSADFIQATASITIACDIITFLIPIPLFVRLQMDTRHKINLIILFAAGNFTVACSIIRMLQIKQVQKDGNNSMLLLWGSVEMNIGVRILTANTAFPTMANRPYPDCAHLSSRIEDTVQASKRIIKGLYKRYPAKPSRLNA